MFKLMVLGLALIGLIGCRDMLPEKETEKETTEIRDNHSYTEIVEKIDNYTNITTTTTTEVTNTTNTSTSTSDSSSTSGTTATEPATDDNYKIAMFDETSANVTAVNWALGAMPSLTFYVMGSTDYAMNQTGVTPSLDNFTSTTTGFFAYTVNKSDMFLEKANVNPDNTSDITLVYKTDLYGYIKDNTKIYEMKPIEFTILVK